MRVRSDIVVVYVVRPDERAAGHEFLQLRRAPGDFMSGTWQTISGRIEGDESAAEAALRELREEAGLRPSEFYRLGVTNSFYMMVDDAIWNCSTWCAIVSRADAIRLDGEHDAWRWIPRSEINTVFMWPTDRLALDHLCRDILDDGLCKPFLRVTLSD
jgi:8-oxo-dGTP pyrophosphatase MutT (NUDIX family)